MQVLLNIPNNYFEDECSPAFAYKERAKIEKQYSLRPQDSVEVVNIGPGADLLVIMTTITVAWNIFQLPGTFKSSLEGWQWLIEKLKGFKTKKQLVSLDLDAAGMLAIDYLAEKYGDDSSFNLMDAHTFKIIDLEGMFPDRSKDSLAAHPHNYYVFTFNLAPRIIVLSVRSTGEIRELESFDDMPYGLNDSEEI